MPDIPRDAARRIRLVILDVDGVLTDNGVYIGDGVELKRFDIQDGLGLKLLSYAGLHVALVSGRISAATSRRAAELEIECYQTDGGHKMEAARTLMQKHGVDWNEVAWLGDDIPDLAPMQKAGLPCAVANATPDIMAIAAWVSERRGGQGAVREFADALLEARGQYRQVVDEYVAQRQ